MEGIFNAANRRAGLFIQMQVEGDGAGFAGDLGGESGCSGAEVDTGIANPGTVADVSDIDTALAAGLGGDGMRAFGGVGLAHAVGFAFGVGVEPFELMGTGFGPDQRLNGTIRIEVHHIAADTAFETVTGFSDRSGKIVIEAIPDSVPFHLRAVDVSTAGIGECAHEFVGPFGFVGNCVIELLTGQTLAIGALTRVAGGVGEVVFSFALEKPGTFKELVDAFELHQRTGQMLHVGSHFRNLATMGGKKEIGGTVIINEDGGIDTGVSFCFWNRLGDR